MGHIRGDVVGEGIDGQGEVGEVGEVADGQWDGAGEVEVGEINGCD